MLKNPAIVGSAGALLGLFLGVLIGRASVGSVDERSLARAEGHLVERPGAPSDREEGGVPPPTNDYHRHLGRKLPRGSKGFAITRVAKRQVAQLAAERSTLRFDIAPEGGESYVLTSVAVLEGAKTAKLQVELDGKPLGESTLNEGWGIYASPIPAGAVSTGSHELAFRKDATGGSVAVESIALRPVTAEVELPMTGRAVGSMIEGFSSPTRDSVWSEGPRSALGVVLSKAEGNYRLKVRAAALSKLAPLSVTATVNGKDLGTALFEKKVTQPEWAIPANTLQAGVNRIEFSYPQTATPSEYDSKSRDNRPLALRFLQVSVQPDR